MAKKHKLLISALIALALAIGYGFYAFQNFPLPILVNRTTPPNISVDEKDHSYGTVEEGIEIPHIFKIKNVGGEPLIIKNVSTSCGCTVLNLASQKVEPGQETDLEVTMDTAMKKGMVTKVIDIESNDPKKPLFKISVTANVLAKTQKDPLLSNPISQGVQPIRLDGMDDPTPMSTMDDPHSNLMTNEKGKVKLFTGKCASCHVVQGIGKKGKALFEADCAMCHGVDAQGKVGPSLVMGSFNDKAYLENFLNITRNGSPTHPSMPGFLKDSGGPLTEAEIQSIADYLSTLSPEKKAQ